MSPGAIIFVIEQANILSLTSRLSSHDRERGWKVQITALVPVTATPVATPGCIVRVVHTETQQTRAR